MKIITKSPQHLFIPVYVPYRNEGFMVLHKTTGSLQWLLKVLMTSTDP